MVDFTQEEEKSGLENVTDAVTKGLPAAVVSAGVGFVNTGIAVTNAFGSDIERVDIGETVDDILGRDVGEYYDSHSTGVDATGLVLGSLIPGLGAIKGLKAGQAALTRTNSLRTGISKALLPDDGIAAISKKIKSGGVIDAAIDLKNNKLKGIAAGFQQQALEAAAFEGAVLLTMNQNAALTPEDVSYFEGITSNLGNAAFGFVFGTTAGGIFSSVANVGAGGKLIKEAWIQQNANIKVGSEGVRQGLIAGDTLLAPANTYIKAKQKLAQLADVPLESREGFKSDITKQIAAAENSTRQILKSLTNGDELLANQLFNTIKNSEGLDDVAQIFSGVKGIKNFSEKDMLMEPPTSLATHVLDLDEAADYAIAMDRANGITNTTKESYKAEFTDTAGAMYNFHNKSQLPVGYSNARGFARTDEFADWENIFTWRHETGHGILNESANAIQTKSKLGKRLIDQATKISRIVSGDRWAQVDTARKLIDSGVITDADRIAQVEDFAEYLSRPRELFAEAYGLLSDAARMKELGLDAMEDFPDVYKFMLGNRGLAKELEQSRQIYNVRTREIFDNFTTPTAADLSATPISVTGKFVTYAGNKTASLDTNFGERLLTDMTWEEASALMSVAQVRKDIVEGMVVDHLDLPKLTAIKAQGIKSFKVAKDGVSTTISGKEIDSYLIDAKVNLGNQLKAKSRKAQHLSQRAGIPITEAENLISDSQIARFIDADIKFVNRLDHVAKLQKSGNKEALAEFLDSYTDAPYWSARPDYNPLEKTFAILQPDRRAIVAGKRLPGVVEAEQRIKADRAMYDNINAIWFGEDFKGLPSSATDTGVNFADNVAGNETTSSFVASANADPLSGQSIPQFIGRTLDRAIRKKVTQISQMFDSDIVRLADDGDAVMEANVLDSVLRQRVVGDEFEFIPTGAGVDGLVEFVDNMNIADKLTDNIVERLGSTGLIDELFSGGNNIWAGGLRKNLVKLLTRDMSDEQMSMVVGAIRNSMAKDIHEIKNAGLAQFWRKMVKYNGDEIVANKNNLSAATGGRANLNPRALYPGVPDTRKFPFHALVVSKGKGVMGERSVGMVTGHDAASLAENMKTVSNRYGDDVEIVTIKQIEAYKKLKGEYESERLFRDTLMDSTMKRQGTAWNVAPQADPQIFNQYKASLEGQQASIGRNMIELKYSEELGALKQYADYLDTYNSSVKKGAPPRNVYKDVESMMLNKRPDNYNSIWNQVNTATEDKISRAFHTVKGAAQKASKTGDWEAMNSVLERYGMDTMYSEVNPMMLNRLDAPTPVLTKLISKMNFALGTMMLRMDFAHALTNVVSMPIMASSEMSALRRVVSQDTWQALRDGTSVKVPGTNIKLPTNMALAHQAVKNNFTRPDLMKLYHERGVINSVLEDISEAHGNFAKIAGETNPEAVDGLLTKVINTISAPSDYSEQFVKFVAADMANQFLTAAKVSDNIKWSAINNFVTRVHGNYLASQRPTLFQGWMGQTVGLFQTYQFNLMQSLFSNVASGNKTAVAKMVGLQAGIFGMQSVPGFQLMNQYIGERSQDNNDFYKVSGEMFGDDLSNFFMYGAASSASVPITGDGIDLYSRGDLTPRTPILIPTSPSELPIVSITSNFLGAIGNAFTKIDNGAPAFDTALDALAHNGLNRPTQGLFQLMAGERTTNNGRLLATYQGWDMMNVAAKLMGTKKLSEAVATSSYYRSAAYSSYRQTELNELGEAFRQSVRADKLDDTSYMNFMRNYTASGGKIESFGGWVNRNTDGAKESVINQLRNNNNSPEGRYLQETMGADIEDYTTDFGGGIN